MASVNVKVGQNGSMLCVNLTNAAVSLLGVEKGDTLTLAKDSAGVVTLSARNENFDEQMAEARKFMARYKNALAELAK
jgi:hypothetical protein